MAFLKCAFAPPDFAVDPGMGIPDQYTGKTLMMKHHATINSDIPANSRRYYLFMPVPGVAFYYYDGKSVENSPPSNAVFTPFYFPDAQLIFPASGQANATRFRYASTAAGVYAMGNEFNTSGSIRIWKTRASLDEFHSRFVVTDKGGVDRSLVSGVRYLTGVDMDIPRTESFVTRAIQGGYTMAANNSVDFEFSDVMPKCLNLPEDVLTDGSGTSDTNQKYRFIGGIPGFGNMDVICLTVDNPSTTAQTSFMIRTWACVEYQICSRSPLYAFAGMSAPYDPMALAMYREIAVKLPPAVPSAENADMWRRISNMMRSLFGGLSFVPGPVGLIAGGADAVVSGLQALTL